MNPSAFRVKATDNELNTPLHYMASLGFSGMVIGLIEAGADVDARNGRGETPLHWAARAGHLRIAQILLRRGADQNATSRTGSTPLMCAAQSGSRGLVKLLVEKLAVEPQATDSFGRSALHLAAEAGHSRIVELLVKADVEIDGQGTLFPRRTPLYLAVYHGKRACVKALVDAGANPDLPDEQGTTPRRLAEMLGYKRILEILQGAAKAG